MAEPASFHARAFSNVNSLWGAYTARVLARLGLAEIVVCPGSRSTPLTYAVALEPDLRATPVLDERSAAFFALGLAKASGKPVALVCTSGTAAANFFPAVVEAAEGGTPLVVLTADRPPELRYSHAGQTIDQLKLFGSYPRFFAEAPVPEARADLFRSWRETLRHAVDCAINLRGPVHLNCPFRDPLPPEEAAAITLEPPEFDPVDEAEKVQPILADAAPPPLPPELREGLFFPGEQTVVVVGPGAEESALADLLPLAAIYGWPVLADGLTAARWGVETIYPHAVGQPRGVPLIGSYEVFLRQLKAADTLVPQRVLQLGDLPTSKALRAWLNRHAPQITLVDRLPAPRNAAFSPAQRAAHGLDTVAERHASTSTASWLEAWRNFEDTTRAALNAALDAESMLREPHVARMLARRLPPATPIFVASSMPVRDWELWTEAHGQRFQVMANRGANGIDGTLSTALGMAAASQRPSVLLTGELALLHDTNGFLLANSGHWQGGLTIFCINNGGGGIFHHLLIAAQAEVFTDYFATPQHVDFAQFATAYGFAHLRIETQAELAAVLASLPTTGVHLLEIITNGETDAAWRKSTYAHVATQLA